jgi:DNA primase
MLSNLIVVASTFSLASCQLSFHQDAFKNSYSVATPSAQTTFTKFFGGRQNSLLNQQQQQPQQIVEAQQPQANQIQNNANNLFYVRQYDQQIQQAQDQQQQQQEQQQYSQDQINQQQYNDFLQRQLQQQQPQQQVSWICWILTKIFVMLLSNPVGKCLLLLVV